MIEVELRSHRPPRDPRFYKVAGRYLAVDGPVSELEPFAAARPRLPRRPAPAADGSGERRRLFRGMAELGRQRVDLDCCWHRGGYDLRVAGLGRMAVARDGGRIAFEGQAGLADGSGLAEVFLGPALTLALALKGVFCLHASAVEVRGQAVAFVGESGKGKSTLAEALPRLSPAFRCAADDLLPVTLAAGTANAWPRFPQLKYRSDRQPGAAMPPSVPLAAVYLLDPRPGGAPPVAAEELGGCAAVLALVRHTMAACLFTPELLRGLTEQCVELASRVPVRRLSYPKVWEALPRIGSTLRELESEPRCRE